MSTPTPPDPTPSRAPGGTPAARVRLAALGVLLVTFAAGVALGWGASRWSRHRGGRPAPRRPPVEIAGRFLDRLDLTRPQRTSIDSILERRRAQLDAFWSGPGRELRLIVDSTRSEVRAVLTPRQRAVYDSIAERHRRDRPGEPRGGGGGGPRGPSGRAPGGGPTPPDERE